MYNRTKAECISYTKEGKDYKTLEIHDFNIKLPFLPSHSRLYVILEIKTDKTLEKNGKEYSSEIISSVSFMKKQNGHNLSSRHSLSNRLNHVQQLTLLLICNIKAIKFTQKKNQFLL